MVAAMSTRPEDREDAMYEIRFHMSSSEDAPVYMSQCADINVDIEDNQDVIPGITGPSCCECHDRQSINELGMFLFQR